MNSLRMLGKVAAVGVALVVLGALIIPSVSAKTGKFQVVSWRPPTTVKGKKTNGILVVKQTIKDKKTGKAKVVNRVIYVPDKVAKRFAKIQPGYIVTISFKERKKGKDVLARGDASSMKIVSSGSGDASGSEGGGAGESESRAGGGGGT